MPTTWDCHGEELGGLYIVNGPTEEKRNISNEIPSILSEKMCWWLGHDGRADKVVVGNNCGDLVMDN